MNNPPLTVPNCYFFIFVFKSGDAPKLEPIRLETHSTIHFRDYVTDRNVTLQVVVPNRIAELKTNPDSVPDMMSNPSAYEIRIVDLTDDIDGNTVAIQAKLKELQGQGYGKALHYQLACVAMLE